LFAEGMAKHVWVGLKTKLSSLAGTLHHPGESGRSQGRTTL
jgi:hypothetical protein